MFTIDLKARFVSQEKRVWRLFPGIAYTALSSFQQQAVVFLDLPGLDLPEGALPQDIPQLRERVLLARATKAWRLDYMRRLRRGEVDDLPSAPSLDLSNYSKRRGDAHTSDIGSVVNLFREAKKGDLVIVPDRLRTRRVYVGELIGPPTEHVKITIDRYGDSPLVARRVRWSQPIDEGNLPEKLTSVLRTPNPMTLLDHLFYTRIFDEVYKTYYTTGSFSARFYTEGVDYTNRDNFNFGILIKLISSIEADLDNYPGTALGISDLAGLLLSDTPTDFDVSLACSIHSPGFLELKAARITPLVIAALFALMTHADAKEKPEPGEVKVVNSANAPDQDPCLEDVNREVIGSLKMMNLEVWHAACKKALSLRDEPKMKSGSTVRGN